MSLQAWMPLNGNLINNGLSNLNITGTATSTTGGKVTSNCYSFNSNYLKLSGYQMTLDQDYTIALWAKCSDSNPQACIFSCRNEVNSNQRCIFIYGAKRFLFDEGNRWDVTVSLNYNVTEWNHYVFTKKGTERKIYINGILASTNSSASTPAAITSDIFIGMSQSNATTASGNALVGKINDYRIYDHCLSQTEVSRLAEGLVFEYDFENPELTETINYAPALSSNWNNYMNGNNGFVTNEYGTKSMIITNKQAWCGAYSTAKISEAGTYTLSVYVKCISRTNTSCSPTLYINGCGYSDNVAGANWKPGEWQRVWMRRNFTAGTLTIYLIAYGGPQDSSNTISCEYRDLQLERSENPSEYVQNSRPLNNITNQNHRWSISGPTATVSGDLQLSTYNVTALRSSGDSYIYMNANTYGNVVGKRYMLSCEIKADKAVTVSAFPMNNLPTEYLQFPKTLSSNWQRVIAIYTFTQAALNNSNGNCHFALPYSSNSSLLPFNISIRDTKIVDLDEAIVYDESGYQYELVNSGVIIEKDSSGKNCGVFKGNNHLSSLKNSNAFLPTDAVSVCWWGYMDNWGSYTRAISCTEGGGWNFEPISGKMNFPVYKTGTGYVNATSSDNLSSLSSGWHFFAGTFDGYVSKLYIDGELKGSSADSTTKALINYPAVKLSLGCEAPTTSPYYNGKLSDVKVYATALSADRIKNIYQSRQQIDKDGNLYGKFNEGATNLQFNKTSIIDASIFNEIYQYTDGSLWIPVSVHNNHSGTNLFPTSGDYTKPIYLNDECYINLGLLNSVDHGTEWEFLVVQQAEENGPFTNYRFKQKVNPMTATWDTVKPGSANVTLAPGSNYGGTYYMNGLAKMCFTNSNSGNWFGWGCNSSHQGGIPSICNTVIKGYQIVYLRIYSTNLKIEKTNQIITNELKQI